MDIEIDIVGNNKPRASSYSSFYASQGDSNPDVIVREAIQNSLDAGQDVENADFVAVDFTVGEFTSGSFLHCLSGISDGLATKYPEERNHYLAIRDKNTSGLTGAMDIEQCPDPENPGNLVKLVFTIAQPNKAEGAGGSYGIGKTIFYTLGAGIVVFYSRIFEENLQQFQSRLVICMIDIAGLDIIPNYKDMNNTGIAWWGKKVEERDNKVIPITDELQIQEILNIFGISPYADTETGTTLVIPYIKPMVDDNKSLIEEIRKAVWRWYFPRLLNLTYKEHFNQKYLKVSINGKPMTRDGFPPLISIYQALYNKALTGDVNSIFDQETLSNYGVEIRNREIISINKDLTLGQDAGYLAYCIVTPENLRLGPPDNNENPAQFFGYATQTGVVPHPTFGFSRRAGMIGSFNNSEWMKFFPKYDNDSTFLLSIFVLNSNSTLRNSNITLDEYARKSEQNDHKDWGKVNDYKKLFSRLKNNVGKKLSTLIIPPEQTDGDIEPNQTLIDAFSDLLPPKGYGAKPNHTTNNSSSKLSKGRASRTLCKIADIRYDDNGVFISYEINTEQVTKSFDVKVLIQLLGGKVEVSEWKELGLSIPFNIEDINIDNESYEVDKISLDNYTYGFRIRFNQSIKLQQAKLEIKIKLYDRTVKLIPEFIWN